MISSIKIDVRVKNNGHEIGSRPNSPVRKLPNGAAGIVVSGLVYPLHEDHSIDLAEEGIPKADCPDFFRPSEDLVYVEADEEEDWWFVEETRWRSYLAFDGSEAFAERLNAAFKEEGLSDGYRESFRPAKNGQFYDYFIRLPLNVDDADIRRIIDEFTKKEHENDGENENTELARLLIEDLDGPKNFIKRWMETASAKSQLEQEIEGLRDRDRRQQQELEATNAELQREREERRRISAQLGSVKAKRDQLQSELKASRDAAGHSDVLWDDVKSKEIDRLSEEVTRISEQRDILQSDFLRLSIEANKDRERIRSLESELEIHNAEQKPTESRIFERPISSKKEKQILNDFISGAFPRLVLEDSDLKALLREFGSISGCAKVMCDLQEGRDPPHLKPWEGIKGVFEVPNISTGIKGRERMGRIYFRSSEGGKIDLAVQIKSGDGNQQGEFVKKRFR